MPFEEKSRDYAGFAMQALAQTPGAKLDPERWEAMVPVSLDDRSIADLIDQLQMLAHATEKHRVEAFLELVQEARLEAVGQAVGQLRGKVLDLQTWRDAFGREEVHP
jgi:hypothetical protein